ncbi:MAG: hypothetical protein AB1430_18775 [Pseudomonadota bacterium]
MLIGRQLELMNELVQGLQQRRGDTRAHAAWRELRDRAAAHFQAREQILLPALRRGGWKGLNNEALVAHMDLKRALAALCICEPADSDFPQVLRGFSHALEQQQLADKLWIVSSLRRLTSESERRRMCEEIERLYAALIPPADHYLEAALHTRPGIAVLQDAAVVLSSLPGMAPPMRPPRRSDDHA